MAENGSGGGRIVAVLGYSSRRSRALHPVCADRLAHGQHVAEGASAVVLSGWTRRPTVRTEAELMRAAWAGPDVPLICDRDARTTADNAANVAALACALGADELVVVTSWWHRPRAKILLRVALRGRGVRVSVTAPRGSVPPVLLARELACLALLPLHVRRARRPAGGPASRSEASGLLTDGAALVPPLRDRGGVRPPVHEEAV